MNQAEWISLAIFVTLAVVFYGVAPLLESRLGQPLRRLLRPLAERICPSLKMEPWLFEPIAADDLPTKQRHFFETHTPAFIARGFEPLGDFVLRRDPQPSCVRFFISRDCTAIGELNCYLGDTCIGCISVLLDGFYMESGTCEVGEGPPAAHGLAFYILKTDDAAALIEHHLASTMRASALRNSALAPLRPEDLQAVVNYGRELSLRSLHRQGVLTDLPEFLTRVAARLN
jgi:hypothetical protein